MRGAGRLAGAARLLLLLAAGLLVGLLVAEGAVRLLMPQILLHDPDAFDGDPVLGGRLRAGFSDRFSSPEYSTRWEINRHGHRGPPAGGRPAGRRVAAVGDSFTFGYGVEEEEAWPRVLERLLAAGTGKPAEVVNLGVGGYGTVQEAAWLGEHLDHGLDPDLVILGFYPGNDLSDSVRGLPAGSGPGHGGEEGGGAPAPLSGGQRLRRWLGSTFQLYSLVSERGDALLLRLGLRKVVFPEEVDVLREPEPASITRGWEAVAAALAEVSARGREEGFDLLVMLIPMRHQVVQASWERVRSFYDRSAGDPLMSADLDAPRRRLREICEGLGIPLLDLVPVFRSAEEPAALYFARDQHWTAAGHAGAAGVLEARLSRDAAAAGAGPDRARPHSGPGKRSMARSGGPGRTRAGSGGTPSR